jgi:E3 ubiquitin-protein ligase BAH
MSNRTDDKRGKIVEVTETENQRADQSTTTDQHIDDDDNIFQTDEDIAESLRTSEDFKSVDRQNNDDPFNDNETARHRTIEIILHADSEFFDLLSKELSSIDDLQARQKEQLTSRVNDLGKDVLVVTKPSKSGSTSDLYAWRQIFSLYRDASVFFAMTERDHGARNAQQARERVQWFQNQIANQNLV